MSDSGIGQLIKAGLLLAALVSFAVWQFRDLDRARRETAQRRARQAAEPLAPQQPAARQDPP